MRALAVGMAVLALSACGASTSTSQFPLPSRASVPSAAPVSLLSSRSIGRLGDVLTDSTGRTIYLNADEPADANACATECQRTWPLLLAPASGVPSVGGGAEPALLGRLTSGTRVLLTYAGHPLHEYVGDPDAGDAFGQGVQLVWSAITVSGRAAVGSP